ncbi:aspartic proteinase NANA, chloroplast-like [Nymphaea colorata]|nr:aspartic proteinase NANA, chloroplast-like [Nymphaea colorata]
MAASRFLPVFLALVSAFISVPPSEANGGALHFRLVHRSQLEGARGDGEVDAFRRLDDITRRDQLRQKHIAETLRSPRRKAIESSFEAPILSGAYSGAGEYFVKLKIGSPARDYLLVADTGSDLTWTKCQEGVTVASSIGRRRATEACVPSSSFAPYKCSTDSCESLPFSTTVCPTPQSPCLYDYRYADGSFTKGTYGNDTVLVTAPDGSVTPIRDVLVGRSSDFQGVIFDKTDGVLGLGFSPISFAITTAQLYGGKFSYCLVDHLNRRDSNYLVFGNNSRASQLNIRYATLVLDSMIQPYYGIEVDGISMDGKMLPIPPAVWKFVFKEDSIAGGVIIDSGMTLTSLVKPAYDVVMSAFRSYFKDFPTFTQQPFDLCFNVTQLSPEQAKRAGPNLAWHFSGGAKFTPHIGSYVTVVAPNLKCIAIVPAAWPGISIIGNIHQQKYLWEFDLANGRLGFAPSLCTE